MTAVFHIQDLYRTVFNQHRVTLRTHTQTALGQVELQAQCLGESAAAVSDKTYFTASLLLTTPRTHHEWIINRDAPDFIHALGFELICHLDIGRRMLLRAGRGKSNGRGEDRDFLAFGGFMHHHFDWSDCESFACDVNVLCEPRFW